ncbi:hypothetical protein [Sulfurimonas sp.]|uniref:hypothetical protein n=1 Tax=Sulfurimonas sp. TaxID=2022749 RepID=UPI0025FAC74B|nr:hypothetical protein [Sulfurimonas sp.]
MQMKTNYENLGVITKQLPSKLFETDKGLKIDGTHTVGSQLVREKTGKKKVHVFEAKEWREMPKNKVEFEKREAPLAENPENKKDEDNHDA